MDNGFLWLEFALKGALSYDNLGCWLWIGEIEISVVAEFLCGLKCNCEGGF